MKITDKYVFFWNDLCSNFEFVDIEHKGNVFPTTEHAFMWEKAMFFGDKQIANELLTCKLPGLAKNLGRQVKNFDAGKWDEVCYEAMLVVNRIKWNQPKYKKFLLETEERILVEASPYDRIWGIGMKANEEGIEDEANWKGHNLLGKVLMDVRKEIQEKDKKDLVEQK
jgi:ribA/ribD-fused uncharacterized protein